MARTTISFGVVLIALGVVGYLGAGGASVTALIPAGFGAVLAVVGGLALNEPYRNHAVRVAAMIALMGLLGTVRSLLGIVDLIAGANVERPAAVVAQATMALLMAAFVGLCVKFLMDARRARIKKGAEPHAHVLPGTSGTHK